MSKKLLSKMLATMLVVTLTFTNFILLGVYAVNISYGAEEKLEFQDTKTNNENVEFDAYFKDDKSKKIHSIKRDFDSQGDKLYVSVQVKKGYLKNAVVSVVGENNSESNLKIVNTEENFEAIESIDIEKNQLALKQLNSGTQVILEIPIVALKQTEYNLSNLNKINEVKLTGSYVGDDGKTVTIQKTIQVKNEWTKTVKPVLSQNITKFVPFSVGDKEGTILQTVVESGLENNALPISKTQLQIEVPVINNEKPDSVWVISNSTKATNGKDGEDFTNEQWNYDKDSGIVTINVTNEANDNKVSWNLNEKDEYTIGYLYNKKVDAINSVQKATLNIEAYSSEETKVKEESILEINQESKLGEIISIDVKTDLNEMGKGFLYTKAENGTSYEENVKVEVSNIDVVEKLQINENEDDFIISDTEKLISTTSNIIKTTISKENFEKILGADGNITIYNANGEQIATINNESIADENGNYVVTYENSINQLKIETSKPISNGVLEFVHAKTINGKTSYTKAQIASFKTLQVAPSAEAYFSNTAIANVNSVKNINLVEPSTQIEVSTSTNKLSTVVKNENVELRVILKSNNISCDLFKNPVIEMTLPNYIESFELKDIKLLFDNELEIQDYNVTKNSNGNYVLHINVKGEDTKYNLDEVAKGANIVVNADITLAKLTPTTDGKLQVRVTNENLTSQVAKVSKATPSVYAETILNAVAPVGIVTINKLGNYNVNGEEVTSISGEEQVGKLETRTDAKVATVTMSVINNYQNPINNVMVLGRIPFEGNKNTNTGDDLGSNLTTILNSKIRASGIDESKVTYYYSANGEATKDLTLDSNGWTTNTENLASIKSYLIVINDYQMNVGETIELSYDVVVPADLPHNLSSYAIYTVYFDNIKEVETISENVTATKVGLTTGAGPELEVSIEKNGATVEEGKEAVFTLTVKNVGKTEVKNVKVNGTVKQQVIGNSELTKNENTFDENTFDTIAVGSSATVTYTAKAMAMVKGNYENYKEEIILNTQVTADDLEKPISNEERIEVKDGYLNITLDTGSVDVTADRRENDEVEYVLQLDNANYIEKENVVVTDVLPAGVTFVKSSVEDATYDEKTRTVTWNIGTLKPLELEVLVITVKIDALKQGETQKTISNKMKITTKDKVLETDTISFEVKKPLLKVVQSVEASEVEVGEKINYHVTISNAGGGEAKEVILTDIIPDGLKYEEVQFSIDGKTFSTNVGADKVVVDIPVIKSGESIEVTITMSANELGDGISKKEIKNVVTASGRDIEEVSSNEVAVTVIPKKVIQDPTTGGVIENIYKISGVVWIDENKDGKKDENEKRLPNTKVTLIDANTGKIVTDIETSKKKEQVTGEDGSYSFSNLVQGIYMVVFEYDTGNYTLTTYQKDGVNYDQNSDVISANAVINVVNKKVGTTDKITVTANQSNIDMGLVLNPQFDLKLDKVITKITVQDGKDNKSYNYNNSKLAKLDLNPKTINNTTIVVEYKIRVTNEGGVAGFAKKIVDYLPSGMKFSSELNKDWYQANSGESGNVYNASLANTLIQPGETKELTLVLTKKMTENDTGIINNNAEICEAYNDLGLSDIDSSVNNKAGQEDDLSSADALIGIKTGEIYIYITLTMVCIAVLGVGIYFINKKVLARR